jgi:nucleoside triphosphate pyrophosphatase
MRPLVLASASPRRRQLLAEYGYQFTVVPADIEEIAPRHLTPREIALWNARAKARAVAARRPNDLVLGVDTLVAFEDRIFGKPRDFNEAFAMVSELNGRSHEVFSGVCLIHAATREEKNFSEVSRVHFRKLNVAQLRAYLARIGPLDKAGAYAAQDDRGEIIDRVEGSFTNVIGLPMEALAEALSQFV